MDVETLVIMGVTVTVTLDMAVGVPGTADKPGDVRETKDRKRPHKITRDLFIHPQPIEVLGFP